MGANLLQKLGTAGKRASRGTDVYIKWSAKAAADVNAASH
jgi:hypothetical protein